MFIDVRHCLFVFAGFFFVDWMDDICLCHRQQMAPNGVKQRWPKMLNAIALQIDHVQTSSVPIPLIVLTYGMNTNARK